VGMPTRKRYSSTFGHRYAASGGAASEGSTGSGGERGTGSAGPSGSSSYLNTNPDDDDISMFMQDIDTRKPLIGRKRLEEQQRSHHRSLSEGGSQSPIRMGSTPGVVSMSPSPRSRLRDLPAPSPLAGEAKILERSETEDSSALDMSDSGQLRRGALAISPPAGTVPMLTNESEVDKRLKAMNDAFLASLEGLGGDRTIRRGDRQGD